MQECIHTISRPRLTTLAVLFWISLATAEVQGQPVDKKPGPRTFFVTRSLTHPDLMRYLQTARPEIVQIGNYGAMFHGYADHEKSTGWPMQLPVVGEKAALEYQRKLNAKVHALGLKVVGHFRLVKVMGNWKEQSGFVEYYQERWPTDLLGSKPHEQLIELLQRDAQGQPIQLGRYGHGQLAFCLSSPHTRKMFKQMLQVAIAQGIDGVNTTYNYHFGCVCPHCQKSFKAWLAEHYTAEQIKAKLGIDHLASHQFTSIPARIAGYPKLEEASELDWMAANWGARHFKKMFDEIFVDYGRSLKKDLLVAQWNHLSHVSVAEERAFLPIQSWGRGEDYFWYSGGAAFVRKNLNLKEGKAGDAWLSCLYVRELGGGRPFVIGKYDGIRLAASMAEGYATGGLGMGRYMRFEDPVGFEVLARYTQFMHKHRKLYDGASPYSDAALVLPRQSVLSRRPEALDRFRQLGQKLLEKQILLDVLVDGQISRRRLAQYQAVILADTLALSDGQLKVLKEYDRSGPDRQVLTLGQVGTLTEQGERRRIPAYFRVNTIKAESEAKIAEAIRTRLIAGGGSEITSPWTVRAAAYTQPNRVLLHLVNYDRDESKPAKELSGPAAERPKPVEDITVNLRLPAGRQATRVILHAPDHAQPLTLDFVKQRSRVTFTVPRVQVYGICEIQTGTN